MRKFWAIGIGAVTGVAALAGVALAQMPQGDDRGGDDWGPGQHEEMGWHHHHHPMMMGGGTHFHFRKGDSDVDIHCSGEESLQACVAAAGSLIDRLNGSAAPAAKPPSQ